MNFGSFGNKAVFWIVIAHCLEKGDNWFSKMSMNIF